MIAIIKHTHSLSFYVDNIKDVVRISNGRHVPYNQIICFDDFSKIELSNDYIMVGAKDEYKTECSITPDNLKLMIVELEKLKYKDFDIQNYIEVYSKYITNYKEEYDKILKDKNFNPNPYDFKDYKLRVSMYSMYKDIF